MLDIGQYTKDFDDRVTRCFQSPGLTDHRDEHPWLRGWLGDPNASIWFLSEAPSQWRVERGAAHTSRTPEDQWAISPGDQEFRNALALARFKDQPSLAPGGWHCYITTLAKSLTDFSAWRHRPLEKKMPLFRKWAPVLAWELEVAQPRLVVAMGQDTADALDGLLKEGLAQHSGARIRIWSYGYLMQPTRGGSPAMDPARVSEYRSQVEGARRTLEDLSRK